MIGMKQKGFTLLELLIVMMIIGVLTAVVSVNFARGNRANDLRQISTELEQNIRLAQGYATGGNSIDYCVAGSVSNEYQRCVDDTTCGGAAGSCTNGVPPGGYGIRFNSPFNYTLFANTNSALGYYDAADPDIIFVDNSDEYIGVVAYRIGGMVFDPTNDPFDIVFGVPEGTISFYVADTLATETAVDLLVQSNFLPDNCKTISINRISAQISQRATACGL